MAVKKDPRLSEPLQGDGPGAYLRKAREEAQMSVDKVATALLLNSHTVEALEADAYERLPAPTFVRGYLRGYARVLGLPSRSILEMYDRQGFEPPALTTDVAESTQAHTSDAVVRFVTYAVAVVLVVLVGLWWHSQEDGGIGIAGDLFDRSADTGEDSSLQGAGESGTTPDGIDAHGETVAMVSGPSDERPLDEEFSVPPPAGDAQSGDHAASEFLLEGAGAEGEFSVEAPQQPDAEPADEASPVTTAADGGAPGDVAAIDPASAGAGTDDESDAMAPLQPGTSPEAEGSDAGVEAAESAVAGTEADGEPGATASTSSPGEGTAVTATVEETTTGEIVEVESTPPGPEAQDESIAGTALQPGTSPGDDVSAATTPGEATASDDTGDVESAPTDASVPEAAVDQEPSASPEPQSGTVAGVGGTADFVPGPESPDGSDGEDAADESASAPETTGATPGTGAETAAAQSGLVLEFVHESWVEVYDRERTRLFFGLVQPDRTLSFDAPQPFDVLLGYGKDVRVAIDGQAFDHTPYLKHGVARFSIGAGPGDGTGVAESDGTVPREAAETPATNNRLPERGR